jgi:D-alanine-D-alanine ligase
VSTKVFAASDSNFPDMRVDPLKIGVVIDTAQDFTARFELTNEQCGELSPQVQVDATVTTLRALGHDVDLIGSLFELVQRLAGTQPGQDAPWDLIFNVAEGMFGTAREAQVPALLEAYQVPFTFADAATMVLCMDKTLAKVCPRVAEVLPWAWTLGHFIADIVFKLRLLSNGLRTAQFIMIPAEHACSVRYLEQGDGVLFRCQDHEVCFKSFPLFVKPNSEGSSKGINQNSRINCMADIQPAIDYIVDHYPDQGLLIEPFLAGREVSVGVLGTGQRARVLGTLGVPGDLETASTDIVYDVSHHVDGANGTCGSSGGGAVQNTGGVRAAGFLTYQDKLDIFAASKPVHEHIDSDLVTDAEALALKAHLALGLRDASRIDIRYDKHGPDATAYVLEVRRNHLNRSSRRSH